MGKSNQEAQLWIEGEKEELEGCRKGYFYLTAFKVLNMLRSSNKDLVKKEPGIKVPFETQEDESSTQESDCLGEKQGPSFTHQWHVIHHIRWVYWGKGAGKNLSNTLFYFWNKRQMDVPHGEEVEARMKGKEVKW